MTGTWRAFSCTLRSGRFLRRLAVRVSPKKEEASCGNSSDSAPFPEARLAAERPVPWLQAGIEGERPI